MLYPNFRLTPARRIRLKRSGIRLEQILARLAAIEDEFRKLNSPRPNKPR